MQSSTVRRLALTAFVAGFAVARAGTLVEVSGPNDIGTTFSSLGNNDAVGFSLASAQTNVSVSVSLAAFTAGDWNLQAFLTRQIGPGTTAVAHEVASSATVITLPGSTFLPPYTITPYTVFSGLNLAAGNYYLILSGTFNTTNVFWVSSPSADVITSTTGGSAVILGQGQAGDPNAYLPASQFPTSGDFDFWFKVTGDPVIDPNAVPEPSTFAFCGIAIALAVVARRRN